MRDEIEDALRATTEMLSRATRLLALVSAPSLETATIRHVEVLALQPTSVMVVVITSTGGVTKRVFRLEEPVDPGLVSWAGEYLERAARRASGSARARCAPPRGAELSPRERAFLDTARPGVPRGGCRGRPAGLRRRRCRAARARPAAEELEATLQPARAARAPRRGARLLVSEALEPRRPVVHVGPQLDDGQLHDLSLVGATYGLRTARSARSGSSARSAWTTRRRSARCARRHSSSRASSKTSTRTTEHDGDARARLLRGARRRRATRATPRSSGRSGSLRASCTRTSRARPRPSKRLPRGRRGVRGAVGPRAPGDLRPLRPCGTARAAASSPTFADFGNIADVFAAFFGEDLFGGGARDAAGPGRRHPGRARDRARGRVHRRRGARIASTSRLRARRCGGAGAEPGTGTSSCRTCGGAGVLRRVSRNVFGEFVSQRACPQCGGRGQRARGALPALRR